MKELVKGNLELITVHTGQHYDANMSDVFFASIRHELTQTICSILVVVITVEQTASMMIEIEKIILGVEHPDGMVSLW